MDAENIINSILHTCNSSKFIGQTYSHGPGFKIEFKENGIMHIQGGNLGLPKFIYLELGVIPKLIFVENEYIDEKHLYQNDPEKILEKIQLVREYGHKIETDWQILRLLDPRILLKDGNYKLLGMGKNEDNSVITIGYDIVQLKQSGDLKISDAFFEFLRNRKLTQRAADFLIDENHNLNMIKQNEILSSRTVSIKFQFMNETIIEEQPIII